MITFRDNFFDAASLNFLQNLIDNTIDHSSLKLYGQWKKNRDYYSPDLSVIKQHYGPIYHNIFDKVKVFAEDVTGCQLGFHSFRLQATLDSFVTDLHYDKDITQQGPDSSFTSIVYLHKAWDSSYGGQFYTENIAIDPMPNRLVFYSRDEHHGVKSGTAAWPEPRKLILLSWYKI